MELAVHEKNGFAVIFNDDATLSFGLVFERCYMTSFLEVDAAVREIKAAIKASFPLFYFDNRFNASAFWGDIQAWRKKYKLVWEYMKENGVFPCEKNK